MGYKVNRIMMMGDNDMRGPSPKGFHVPSIDEWQGLKTIMDGLSLTTGPNWIINLHIPLTGYRNYYSAGITNQGGNVYYWSVSPYGSDRPNYARSLYLSSSSVEANGSSYRSFGYPIRCFKNSFELPTSSWTIIKGTLGSSGIFWNQTDGLISITNGTTGYTIMDKNLGATAVYNNGDTLTQANMGNMYQWGNNYGFPSTGNVTTSSTQVDASSYGPGNYYSSSSYIIGSSDWSSVQNDNLWGGVSQGGGENQIYPANILPLAYQEVEYIQSSGTQLIDTGYLITPNTEVSVDYQFTSANSQDFVFGVGSDTNTSSGMTFCVYIGYGGSGIGDVFRGGISDGTYNNTWTNDGPTKDTNRHTFVLNNGHFLTYNSSGTLQSDVTTQRTITRTAEHSFGLFCWWRTDLSTPARSNKTSAKLYSCKVKESGTLVRDYIPCYRKSDSVIGLYDLYGRQFYTNAGSGTFTKGPNV